MRRRLVRVLTIAGSDSGGGAGIQADIRAITTLGAFPTCVVTAVTAQNTRGVKMVRAMAPTLVAAQIDAVMSDIKADAVKTGMLPTPAIVRCVALRLRRYNVRSLVVDPVVAAHAGGHLASAAALRASIKWLFPIATVVTPNTLEASLILEARGKRLYIDSVSAMRRAAQEIFALGPAFVLVKGGHLPGQRAVDLLYDGRTFHLFTARRSGQGAHGAGCTFSAVLATLLGHGMKVPDAAAEAKRKATEGIHRAIRPGRGRPVALLL